MSEPRALARLITPQSFDEAMAIAEKLAASDLVPKAYKGKPANMVIAWEMGAELGLSPMTALQSIAVINGKPSLYGEAPLAIVMASGLLEQIAEELDAENRVATCTVKRKGLPEIRRQFSMEEADQAQMWEVDGHGNGSWKPLSQRATWKSWWRDMLKYRARGRALKDAFPDVLKGVEIQEASLDTGAPEPNGVVIEARAERVESVEEQARAELMPRAKPAAASPDLAPALIRSIDEVRKEKAAKAADTPPAPAQATTPAPALTGQETRQEEAGDAATPPGAGSITQPAYEFKPHPAPETVEQDLLGEPVETDAPTFPDPTTVNSCAIHTERVKLDEHTERCTRCGRLLYNTGGHAHETNGITRAQLLEIYGVRPVIDRKKGKGTCLDLMKRKFNVGTSDYLTEAQAAELLEAFYELAPEKSPTKA